MTNKMKITKGVVAGALCLALVSAAVLIFTTPAADSLAVTPSACAQVEEGGGEGCPKERYACANARIDRIECTTTWPCPGPCSQPRGCCKIEQGTCHSPDRLGWTVYRRTCDSGCQTYNTNCQWEMNCE